jgi:hypothetical protein
MYRIYYENCYVSYKFKNLWTSKFIK